MMKSICLRIVAIWLAVGVGGVLSGCGADGDRRVVDLEKRVALLEGRLAIMERQMLTQGMRVPPRRGDGRDAGDVSRRMSHSPEQLAERQRLREEVRKRLEERRDKARAKKPDGEAPNEAVKESVRE